MVAFSTAENVFVLNMVSKKEAMIEAKDVSCISWAKDNSFLFLGHKDGKVAQYRVDIKLNKYEIVDEAYEAIAGEIITGVTFHDPIIASTSSTGKMQFHNSVKNCQDKYDDINFSGSENPIIWTQHLADNSLLTVDSTNQLRIWNPSLYELKKSMKSMEGFSLVNTIGRWIKVEM